MSFPNMKCATLPDVYKRQNSIDANFAELQKAQDKEQTAGQEQPTREGQEDKEAPPLYPGAA